MSSWFQSSGLTSAFESLNETVQAVTESVQEAIPTEHKEFLSKLTLNTDEMISERKNYKDEEFRKAAAKDRLNRILPWETLDAEREILVEECRDAILELSETEETFFGPFEMPLLNVDLSVQETLEIGDETKGDEEEAQESAAGEEDSGFVDGTSFVGEENNRTGVSEESQEMLAKLEPLPPLLEDFDLDEHVGLIQRVLKEDPKLVMMQAKLSGGGARERIFWRNYFFHCAFTRYKCGLSLDEIWSHQEESSTTKNPSDTTSTEYGDADVVSTPVPDDVEEEAIIFDNTNVQDETKTSESSSDGDLDGTGNTECSFQLIDEDLDEAGGDPELDELEAEIARELED